MDRDKELMERFKNLLTVKHELYLEEISTTFTEYDLKYIIWLVGDYIAIKEKNGGK